MSNKPNVINDSRVPEIFFGVNELSGSNWDGNFTECLPNPIDLVDYREYKKLQDRIAKLELELVRTLKALDIYTRKNVF